MALAFPHIARYCHHESSEGPLRSPNWLFNASRASFSRVCVSVVMATYRFDIQLKDVDTITGVSVTFSGKVKGGRRTTVFSQAQTPFNGSLNFSVSGRGDQLIGRLSFSATEDAKIINNGVIYDFINPGSQKVRTDWWPGHVDEIGISFGQPPSWIPNRLMQNMDVVDPLA